MAQKDFQERGNGSHESQVCGQTIQEEFLTAAKNLLWEMRGASGVLYWILVEDFLHIFVWLMGLAWM